MGTTQELRHMIKMVVFIKAKAGLSSAQFRDHYENVHVPLIRRLHPTLRNYRRNYIDRERSVGGSDAWPDFDVVTESCFDDWEGFESFISTSASADVRSQVLADEAHFAETTRTRRLVVEECDQG